MEKEALQRVAARALALEDDSLVRVFSELQGSVARCGRILWHSEGGVVFLDPRASEMHGFDSEVGGGGVAIVEFLARVKESQRSNLVEAFSRSAFEGLAYQSMHPAGQRSLLCAGASVDVEGQEMLLGCVVDQSKERSVHQQLIESQKMDALGQLTAGIAHNFNNILGAILPTLSLLERHVSPKGSDLLRTATQASTRAHSLISELMLVARRKGEHTLQPCELISVIERTIRICETTFGGWIQISLHDDGDFLVLANESQLEQTLLNILLNARDAFESASISCPRITIEVEGVPGDEHRCMVRIVDNGPGMTEETCRRIFEPFFTTKGTGTGLGLATAKAIVEQHGGKVEVSSMLDEGTIFEIVMPIYRGRVRLPTPPPVEGSKGGTERLLLVDDDELVREATAATLSDVGYEVTIAHSGEEALDLFPGAFDALIVDNMMPGLTGLEVIEELRGRGIEVKTLLYTGQGELPEEQIGAILRKPALRGELLSAVRQLFDGSAD